jgi:hypothetical protein
VTQQAVERALGKLLTDENFRERFFENPEAASWEAGLALSPIELEALARVPRHALASFTMISTRGSAGPRSIRIAIERKQER